jgi:dihydrofolate reductase
VVVLISASVIQALLRADLVHDVRFAVVPVIVGGGLRRFPDGLPASRWSLAGTATLAHGAVGLHHRRS